MEEMNKMRDEAFIEAVMNDNWDKVDAYAKKYHITIFPSDGILFKMAIYKATQSCNNIPVMVKEIADKKFIELMKGE